MSSNLAIENRKHIFQELNGQIMKQKRDTERTKWLVQPWMFDYQMDVSANEPKSSND
jgi:hypothetical protein